MHVLLVGATGEVGSKLLNQMLSDERILKVTIWCRKDIAFDHPKVNRIQVNFDDISGLSADDIDAVACCLGTTMKRAGSREAFRKVDHDYVVDIATWAESNGINQFHVVSARGANADSLFFYNRVKGEMEDALFRLPIPHTYVYRPSLIDSERVETRPLERIAILIFRVLNPILIGPFKSIASIKSTTIAAGMLRRLLDPKVGYHVISSRKI